MAGYQQDITRRFQGLLSGRVKPWELPEFQGMETRLQRMGALNRLGMGRQLTAAGVRGPALGMALEKARETEMAPMGEAITSAYRQIPGQAMGWQQHLDALQEAAAQRNLELMRLYLAKHMGGRALEFEKKRTFAGGAMGGIEKTSPMMENCVLATGCYGEDSMEVEFFKLFRDFIIPQKILRGYYIFSDAVLPLMRFKIAKQSVRAFIVNPLLRAGAWALRAESSFDIRLPIDLAISTVVLTFWKILGSRKPYTRKNGEIV